jgi:hypothetical protein
MDSPVRNGSQDADDVPLLDVPGSPALKNGVDASQ